MVLRKGLRIIVINMIYYDINNQLYKNKNKTKDYDPVKQYEFIEQSLINAKNNNEKIWLSYHFGPEQSESSNNYSYRLTLLLDKYKSIIIHGFCGHTHSQVFKLFKNINKEYIHHCLMPGAMYPSNHNAQFRVYKYDDKTFTLLDYDQ